MPSCLAVSIVDTGKEIMARRSGERIEIPVLITHGAADIMTCPKSSALFVQQLLCPDKTYREYPDAFHNRIPSLHILFIFSQCIWT